jgi:predicted methyltransferase
MKKYLESLYEDFIKKEEKSFLKEIKHYFSISDEVPKNFRIPSTDELKKIYHLYYKESFFSFLKRIKDIIYSPSPFDFILKNSTDRWSLLSLLEFLKERKIINIKNDKLIVQNKIFIEFIPPPQTEKEIKEKLEKTLNRNLDLKAPSNYLFQTKIEGEKYDQLPISVSSAIFVVKKILDYLPFKETFLFLGDDDLVSIYLTLSNPKIKCLVVDIDENLLRRIAQISKKYLLKIETQMVNVQKMKKLKGEFVGFLINPVYNYEGVKKFLSFGVNQLGKNGGFVFLELGDESIGNKFLFLQSFFAKKNLVVEEVIKEKGYYPYFIAHPKEDLYLMERFKKFFSQKTIEESPILAESLWIFKYIPFKVKTPRRQPFYIYL